MHADAAAAAAACMRACVVARVIDTMIVSSGLHAARRRPRRGESNFRIEIFANIGHGQKGEFGGQPPRTRPFDRA